MKAQKWVCLRCGHKWNPRIETKPLACPKCKSYEWDKSRKIKENK